MSTDKWMNKENVLYVYKMEYFSAIKEGKPVLGSTVDGLRVLC